MYIKVYKLLTLSIEMSHTWFFGNSNILLIGVDIDTEGTYPLRVIEKIELCLNLERDPLEENNVFVHVRVPAQCPPVQIRFGLEFGADVVIRLPVFHPGKQLKGTVTKMQEEFITFQRDCSVPTSNPG